MDFIELTGEAARIYVFRVGKDTAEFRVEGVTRICVRPSGTHRLETASGRKFIIPAGWIALEIVAAEWSA